MAKSTCGTASPVVRYLDTTTAYDLWSEVYDTDGNFLVALDTIEMKRLLPDLISRMSFNKPWKLVDLGCGTGRNTVALLSIPDVQVVALDISPKMLDIARTRLEAEMERLPKAPNFQLAVFDMIGSSTPPLSTLNADAIVSTLVIEHIPVDIYFRIAFKILRPGGLFLVTNMHAEMGNISQAGFIDPNTGEKIRPKSFSHTVSKVIEGARAEGFEVIEPLKEVVVDDKMTETLGPRSKKWVGITVWFGGIFRKLPS